MEINWKLIDENIASWARPYATYVCSTAIAYACLMHDSAVVAVPVAGAVIGGNIAARSYEKTKPTTGTGAGC